MAVEEMQRFAGCSNSVEMVLSFHRNLEEDDVTSRNRLLFLFRLWCCCVRAYSTVSIEGRLVDPSCVSVLRMLYCQL